MLDKMLAINISSIDTYCMFVIDRLVPHLSNFLLLTWRLLAIFSCVTCGGGNQTEPGPHSWALLRCFLPFCYLAFARPRAVHLELSLFSGFSDRCGDLHYRVMDSDNVPTSRGCDLWRDSELVPHGFLKPLAQLNLVGVWRWWRMVHILKYEKIVCHAIEIRKHCAKTHWRWGRS